MDGGKKMRRPEAVVPRVMSGTMLLRIAYLPYLHTNISHMDILPRTVSPLNNTQ